MAIEPQIQNPENQGFGDTGTFSSLSEQLPWFRHYGANSASMWLPDMIYQGRGVVIVSVVFRPTEPNKAAGRFGMAINVHMKRANVPFSSHWFEGPLNGRHIHDVWRYARRVLYRKHEFPYDVMYLVVHKGTPLIVARGAESTGVLTKLRKYVDEPSPSVSNKAMGIILHEIPRRQRDRKIDYNEKSLPPDVAPMPIAEQAYAGALEVTWYQWHQARGVQGLGWYTP